MNRVAAAMWLAIAGCIQDGPIGQNDPVDLDGDGATTDVDCDDLDPARAPGFDETCDGIDNDCDLTIDSGDCDRTETVVQTMTLDLLLVVDDSASMDVYQDQIAASFGDLFQWVVGDLRDTHLGVITMDMDDPDERGRLVEVDGRRFTDASMSLDDALIWADTAIRRGVDAQFYEERALDAAQATITDPSIAQNEGFRRPDAHLAMLFISDEDDENSTTGPLDFLSSIRAQPGASDFTVHAVVSDTATCLQEVGNTYLGLVDLTGGTRLSICEPDYRGFLSAVGQISAQQGLREVFPLQERAQEGSVRVSYVVTGGLQIDLEPEAFALSGDNDTLVLLGPPPPAGSTLKIEYRLLE